MTQFWTWSLLLLQFCTNFSTIPLQVHAGLAVDSEEISMVNLTPTQPLQRCTDGGHSTLRGSSYTSTSKISPGSTYTSIQWPGGGGHLTLAVILHGDLENKFNQPLVFSTFCIYKVPTLSIFKVPNSWYFRDSHRIPWKYQKWRLWK